MAFETVGIPEDHYFSGLFYERRTRSLVAKTYLKSHYHHGAFWVKGAEEDKYETLCGELASDFDFKDVIFDAILPLVYVNSLELSITQDYYGKDIHGYDWGQILAFDLRSRKRNFELSEIQFSDEFQRVWVSGLLGPAEREHQIIASIGFETENSDGLGSMVQYWICELDVRSGRYDRIAELRGTFL